MSLLALIAKKCDREHIFPQARSQISSLTALFIRPLPCDRLP